MAVSGREDSVSHTDMRSSCASVQDVVVLCEITEHGLKQE